MFMLKKFMCFFCPLLSRETQEHASDSAGLEHPKFLHPLPCYPKKSWVFPKDSKPNSSVQQTLVYTKPWLQGYIISDSMIGGCGGHIYVEDLIVFGHGVLPEEMLLRWIEDKVFGKEEAPIQQE